MKITARLVAAGVTALALAGGIGVGIASADPSSPAPNPTASASPSQTPRADQKADKADRKQRPLTARALHGEATLGGQKHRVVTFQRGTVGEVSATSITIASNDGFTATYVVDGQTKVRLEKAETGISDVKTADRVRIVATKEGSTLTATRIADRGPK